MQTAYMYKCTYVDVPYMPCINYNINWLINIHRLFDEYQLDISWWHDNEWSGWKICGKRAVEMWHNALEN